MINSWFFESWQGILRMLVVGTLIYVILIFYLRIFGKRSLSKMNSFDFVVTVALGSLLASIFISKDLPLAEGAMGLFWILTLQYAITWLSARYSIVEHVVKSEPALLFYQGHMLNDNLRDQRVTQEEVRSAIRQQGVALLEEVEAVILETNGDLSIVKRSPQVATTVIQDVNDYPPSSHQKQSESKTNE